MRLLVTQEQLDWYEKGLGELRYHLKDSNDTLFALCPLSTKEGEIDLRPLGNDIDKWKDALESPTAYEYLRDLPWLPSSTEGKHYTRPSNGEIRRWLLNRAVIINGVRPLPEDRIKFPIKQLVFFPNGKRKTTMV